VRRVLGAIGLALAAASALSQGIPMATLGGVVTGEDGTPLPGVVVRLESSSLQGSREATTSPGGRYLLAALPPGDYRVSFTATGMQVVSRTVTLPAAATVRLDQVLLPASVLATVTVSSEAAPGRGLEVGANIPEGLLNKLPSGRALRDAALLAPGVNENGPSSSLGSASPRPAIMISGAVSYENLFLVNGAVVNENLREQPQDLFIEDAIQETTVQTGRISAEYGRFMGGIVNVVTRSGGNQLAGSFRATLSSDQWTANNAYDEGHGVDSRAHFLNEAYEATLGFPLWKDRVWAFGAGRFADTGQSFATQPQPQAGNVDPTSVPYVYGRDERRFEAKLTAAPVPEASLVISYIGNHLEETNYAFNRNILETETLMPRTLPSSLFAVNGSGVLDRSVFFEAQYSRRRFQIEQTGPNLPDRIRGTTINDNSGFRYGAPQFSGEPPNLYDNDSWSLKGSYLLSTPSLGEHDLRAGYEGFREVSLEQNNFSSSGFVIGHGRTIVRGTEVFPVFDAKTLVQWYPVSAPAAQSNLLTHSVFVNDRVGLGRHWSLNLGLRWDKNHDRASNGALVSDSGSFSPRLGVRFDPRGDGRLVFDAGYAKYVTKIHEKIANAASPAGNVAIYQWAYLGPCINCDLLAPTDALLSRDEALAQLFAWFDSIGRIGSVPSGLSIPGFSTQIAPGGLRSPYVLEASAGAEAALGSRGSVRADLLYRDYRDLYGGRIDLTTGRTPPDPKGTVYDLEVVGNSNQLKRQYAAVQLQARYKFGSRLSVAATYTWSHLTGNSIGEYNCCSAVWGIVDEYPEYKQSQWNAPVGDITRRGISVFSPDERHRARAWIIYQAPLGSGTVSLSALEAFDSGLGYEAVASINPIPYVTNPGYANPLGTATVGGGPAKAVDYYFTKPGAFRTDDVTHTDLALDWTVPVYHTVELFLHAQVFNVANQQAVVSVDTTVTTLAPFNPFTETPIQGVNYELGPTFGKPTGSTSYQQPRTFVLAVGARF
jgi:hypothetical protein